MPNFTVPRILPSGGSFYYEDRLGGIMVGIGITEGEEYTATHPWARPSVYSDSESGPWLPVSAPVPGRLVSHTPIVWRDGDYYTDSGISGWQNLAICFETGQVAPRSELNMRSWTDEEAAQFRTGTIQIGSTTAPPTETVSIWREGTVPEVGQWLVRTPTGGLRIDQIDRSRTAMVVTNTSCFQILQPIYTHNYFWNSTRSIELDWSDGRIIRDSFLFVADTAPTTPPPVAEEGATPAFPRSIFYGMNTDTDRLADAPYGRGFSSSHTRSTTSDAPYSPGRLYVGTYTLQRDGGVTRAILPPGLAIHRSGHNNHYRVINVSLHTQIFLGIHIGPHTWAGFDGGNTFMGGGDISSLPEVLLALVRQFQREYEFETGTDTTTTTNNATPTGGTNNMATVATSPEQKATRDIMLQLIGTKSLKQAESLIQCGLEFEYHRLNGKRRGEITGEIDEEKLTAGIEAHMLAKFGGATSLYWTAVHLGGWRSGALRNIARGLGEEGLSLDTLSEPIRTKVQAEFEYVLNRYKQGEVRQYLLQPARASQYYKSTGIVGWDQIASYTEMGDDGSVEGGEIRTRGPRSITEFLKVADCLSKTDFRVAENTSFHIHLSVKGIKHAYGQRFQAEMYAYLLRNLHRMPDPVRKRLIHERGALGYAALRVSTEKYSAVHFHPQGTWEFRLFGNVHKYEDMQRCLQLAYEALRHAYTVKLGRTDSLLGQISLDNVVKSLQKCQATPEKFWTTLTVDSKVQIEPSAA